MFEIFIVSEQFKGKSLLQQHRSVQDILKEEMKEWHGLTLHTKTPEQFEKMKEDF